MTSVSFPQANATLGAPRDLDESQCRSISAFVGKVQNGSLDGVSVVVVAWKPSLDELVKLASGANVYLSVIGGLPPHFITTSFEDATNVA